MILVYGFDSHLRYMSWNKRYIVENNLSLIKEWEKLGTPLMKVARNLNIKYDTIRKYLEILGG